MATFDVMLQDRYICTMNIEEPIISDRQISDIVTTRLPTLKGKQFKIIFQTDMRVKRKPDFEAISRRSIARDFYPERIYLGRRKTPEKRNSVEITMPKPAPAEGRGFRIININPNCEYAKYARFFVGRLVRLVKKTGIGDSTTGWYQFLRDKDRLALNQAAGWSDRKREYLLENPNLK